MKLRLEEQMSDDGPLIFQHGFRQYKGFGGVSKCKTLQSVSRYVHNLSNLVKQREDLKKPT